MILFLVFNVALDFKKHSFSLLLKKGHVWDIIPINKINEKFQSSTDKVCEI